MVTEATADPITAHVGFQGSPRDPGAKSWCLASLKFVECQTNERFLLKYKIMLYENENRE